VLYKVYIVHHNVLQTNKGTILFWKWISSKRFRLSEISMLSKDWNSTIFLGESMTLVARRVIPHLNWCFTTAKEQNWRLLRCFLLSIKLIVNDVSKLKSHIIFISNKFVHIYFKVFFSRIVKLSIKPFVNRSSLRRTSTNRKVYRLNMKTLGLNYHIKFWGSYCLWHSNKE
jgi:hypothetical protein